MVSAFSLAYNRLIDSIKRLKATPEKWGTAFSLFFWSLSGLIISRSTVKSHARDINGLVVEPDVL